MIRISVSDVDQYRYYRASEDMELDALLRRLRREEPPTPAMAMGTALHSILEDAKDGDELSIVERDGFVFHFAFDSTVELPPIRECKGEMHLTVDGIPVTLVGKVDCLDGQRIWDHKLSGTFDAEKYADSMQWRMYLMMFRAWRFTYNVFVHYEQPDGTILVKDLHSFDFYRYPGMEDDIMRELREYVAFVREHLPEKVAA